jgi:hypothetical protein
MQPAIDHSDNLELCLDLLTPTTLGHLWHDHKNYIERHQDTGEDGPWGNLDFLQQDADMIYDYLTDTHFQSEPDQTQKFLTNLNHIPF